jgi:membrane protein implicated in regulation of membrane protease activity
MNGELVKWVWVAMALFFFVAEIFTLGFVLACFGVGAAVAALLAFAGLGAAWQLLAFVVVSALAVLLSRRFADRVSEPNAERVGVDRVLGKRAVVIEAIEADSASGRVRVEREEWRAEAVDDEEIAAGSRVEVVAVEGTRLRVRRLEDA